MRNFDKTDHAKKLLEVEGVISHAYMPIEGLRVAGGEMSSDKAFASMAIGAFGLLETALDNAHNILSETGTDFVYANGLSYPLERKGEING